MSGQYRFSNPNFGSDFGPARVTLGLEASSTHTWEILKAYTTQITSSWVPNSIVASVPNVLRGLYIHLYRQLTRGGNVFFFFFCGKKGCRFLTKKIPHNPCTVHVIKNNGRKPTKCVCVWYLRGRHIIIFLLPRCFWYPMCYSHYNDLRRSYKPSD